jgi:hypothetical protein
MPWTRLTLVSKTSRSTKRFPGFRVAICRTAFPRIPFTILLGSFVTIWCERDATLRMMNLACSQPICSVHILSLSNKPQ